MTTLSEKARRISELHREWVKTAQYRSIPVDGPSQYPETEEDVHTDPNSDAEFMKAMKAILDEPTTPEPSRFADQPHFEVVGEVAPKGRRDDPEFRVVGEVDAAS